MAVSPEKAKEVIDFLDTNGKEKTLKKFGIGWETLRRYKRLHKPEPQKADNDFNDKPHILKRLAERFTPAELRAMADGGKIGPPHLHDHNIDFSGESFRFALWGDSHIGSVYFKEELYFRMLEEAERQKVEAHFHTGDITEGMSGRVGHVYELEKIGYKAQRDYSIALLKNISVPFYCISGNHDRWQNMAAGADVVQDICDAIPNAHFLGHDVGRLPIKKASIELWHGGDGSSYATSYRLQKIAEAYTGGQKPSILCAGHVHKSVYIFERNIHAVSSGAMCLQSAWMRGRRLANHSGFWIITVYINKAGSVSRFLPEWFPFYE